MNQGQRLILLPAVDVVDGKAVRLTQGRAGSTTSYASAINAALQFQQLGAGWIHLVDLDAAFGRESNAELIAEVVRQLDVPVQLSGGIRDADSLAIALATGCARVNLSTAALEYLPWCAEVIAEHGERIAVALDVKVVNDAYRLRGRGSSTDVGDLWEVLASLDRTGCSRLVVTDVSRDGTLDGPNLDLLAQVARRVDASVIASGGVSCIGDLRAIAALTGSGIEGAIVGKAFYAGRFTLAHALAAVGEGDSCTP